MTQLSQGTISTKTAAATQIELENESCVDEGQGNETICKDRANTNGELSEPAKRISDYLPSIIAIGFYLSILGALYFAVGFNDFTDFTLQKYIFSIGGFVALVVGLNFGYVNPKEKNFWAITDMLWISMAVVALSGVLNPVEETVLKGEVRTAAYISDSTRVLISNDISLAVKSMCASKSTLQECADWTSFSKNVDAANVDPSTLYARVNGLELPRLPQSLAAKAYRNAIEERMESLKQTIHRERIAQSRLDDINIGWAYTRIFLLMIALGLRAGKTGAELRNNPPKTPWIQKLKNLTKRIRGKSW